MTTSFHVSNQSYRATAAIVAALLLLAIWAPNTTANTRVPQDQPPPAIIQHSPSIAIDFPTDHIVVGYTEDPFGANGIGVSYRTHSSPGPWADAAITAPTGGYFGIEEDVSVVSDDMGFVYACYVSYDNLAPNNQNSAVYVARSNDGGATFPTTAQAALQSGPVQSTPFIIQPKVEADEFGATSPHNGNVYTIWEEDLPGNPFWAFSDVNSSWSGFGGTSWSAVAPVNDNRGGDLALWPDNAVATNGDVHAAWLDTPYWYNHQGTIMTDRSIDGGQSYGTDVPAVTLWTVPQMLTDTGGQPTYAAMSYPSIEVDETDDNHICVVYADDPDDGPAVETRIDVGDTPPGASDAALLSPFSGATAMSCSNGFVYSVWVDYRSMPRGVYFNRSNTGIAGWAGPEIMLSSQPYSERMGSNNANIASDGNNVYVVWDEFNGVDFIHQIYFNASYNNGATWFAQAINIDSKTQIYGANVPVVACSGNNVCAAWLTATGQGGPTEISFNRSTNGGATWLTTQMTLSTSGTMQRPDIAMSGSNVYVVWMEGAGTGSEIMVAVSNDYGVSWTGPRRLDAGAAGTIRYAPKVVASGAYAYVVWDDKRTNSTENPYFTSTSNAGFTWFPEQRINTGMAPGMSRDDYPQIDCSGPNVYAVYMSDRGNLNSATDIYFNASYDGGLTWMPNDIPISHGGTIGMGLGSSYEIAPRISVYSYGTDEYVYAVWYSDRNDPSGSSGWDIYATYSNNWGQNWVNHDHRIDVGDQPGANDSELPHIASDWTGPYYMWVDKRNGQRDVYANQYRTGPDEGDIEFIESFNGGATWSTPLRVNDDVGTNDQSHPGIDIKPNGTIDVCWLDKRNCPTDQIPEVYRAVMLPGAGAFNPNQVVSNQQVPVPTTIFGMGDYTWIDVDDSFAHVVWTDGRYPQDNMQGDAYYESFENPIPPESKACCLPGGACLVTTSSECTAAGGDFLEEYDSCDPNPCPFNEPRVCCMGEECVLVLSEMDCVTMGGEFHGELLSCDNNPCAVRYPHADHNIGNCTLTITEQGILGFMDHTQTEGSGFIYPQDGLNQLFIGGPWGSSDPTYVANRDYDTDPEREWTVSSDPDGRVWVDEDAFAHQDIHAIFTDEGAAASMGLLVQQTSWAWSSPQVADDFVIIQYQIENTGPDQIDDFYYGLFMDFDMGDSGLDDEGAADPARNLVYMNDGSGLHLGLSVIGQSRSAPVANLSLVYNPDFVWPEQYVTDPDKYAFLTAADSAHTISESFEANDYSVIASVGPMTIGGGESETVTFAVIGGESLEELNQNALVAQMIMDYGWSDIDTGSDEPFGRPQVTRLLPCHPNPFQDQTTLFFELAQPGEVSLRVFDVNGRQVRSLLEGWQRAGRHPVAWQGEDNAGRKLGQGVYYLRLVTRDTTDSKQIVMMR